MRRGPTAPARAGPRTVPPTSSPAWPTTLDAGQCGMSRYGTSNGVGQRVGEVAEPGAEHDGDVRHVAEAAAAKALGGFVDARRSRARASLTAAIPRWSRSGSWRACRPASPAGRGAPGRAAARAPARRCRRSGCRSTQKLAKPHSANVAMVNDRGSSDVLERPELRVGDELVQHHARAEQVADRRRVAPRHAEAPGDRREHPAEDLLQAQPDDAEHAR